MFPSEYNEHNYDGNHDFGINVDVDGNHIGIPPSDRKVLMGTPDVYNGDITVARKRNQQLFTRTYKEDDDIKKLRRSSTSSKYEN